MRHSTCLHLVYVFAALALAFFSQTLSYCNYVEYSGKLRATNMCYFDHTTGEYKIWFCQYGEVWYYPKTAGGCIGNASSRVPLNASWNCDGLPCGWTQIDHCNQSPTNQTEEPRPFGICHGNTANKTVNGSIVVFHTSTIYKCCDDNSTVLFEAFTHSSTCDSTRLTSRILFNSTCQIEKNLIDGEYIQSFRRATHVRCEGAPKVSCTNLNGTTTTQAPNSSTTTSTSTTSTSSTKSTSSTTSSTTTMMPTVSPTRRSSNMSTSTTSTTTMRPTNSSMKSSTTMMPTTTNSTTKRPTMTTTNSNTTRMNMTSNSPTMSTTMRPTSANGTNITMSPTWVNGSNFTTTMMTTTMNGSNVTTSVAPATVGGGSKSSTPVGLIIALVFIFCIVCCFIAIFCVWRMNKNKKQGNVQGGYSAFGADTPVTSHAVG